VAGPLLAVVGTLRLARPDILPLSAGGDPEAPLRVLAGAAAGLAGGEHAVLQVLARPVTGARAGTHMGGPLRRRWRPCATALTAFGGLVITWC
jgi:hypothetical protein